MAKKKIHTPGDLYTSILYVIVGVLLVIFRNQMLGWAMTIAGIFFIVSGVLDVLKKNYSGGAISLIVGIAIILFGWLMAGIVLLVLGILIAIKGGVALFEVLKKKNADLLDIIFPAATIVIGLVLAFGNGLEILLIIAGVLLAADGLFGLYTEWKKR